MANILQFDEEAFSSVVKGVTLLAKAVTVTLGPKGRNVVIRRALGTPLATKNGLMVAREIFLKDRFENVGAQLVKEVAIKAAESVGDGAATAIVLAHALFSEGVKSLTAGTNPMALKRGMDKAVLALSASLESMARPIETRQEIEQVAWEPLVFVLFERTSLFV